MKRFLHHLFIPHEKNNHRSRILHIDSLVICITLLIFSFSLLSSVEKKYPSVLGISSNISIVELLNLTNKIRAEHGLTPLNLDTQLSQAASNKSSYMFTKDFWAHISPDGVTPWIFIKNSGYEYFYAGENLARGYSSASEVVDAWMASPSHRDNMLSPNYKDVGFSATSGTLTGSDTILVVEMFGSRYKAGSVSNESSASQVNSSSVTQPVIAVLSITPFPSISSELSENPSQPAVPSVVNSDAEVAAIQQKPLIDKNNFTKNLIIGILSLFIIVLAVDAIIIERKKIIRVVSHNLDHIIYLVIILLVILVIGKGLVL